MKARTNRLVPVAHDVLPSKERPVELYENTHDGRLTDEHPFGNDPLAERDDLVEERSRRFFQAFSTEQLFSDCVNGRKQPLKNAILFHIDTTIQLSALL